MARPAWGAMWKFVAVIVALGTPFYFFLDQQANDYDSVQPLLAPFVSPHVVSADTGIPWLQNQVSPVWGAAGVHRKSGAGLLLFAYGGSKTLQHFLREATQAAATFRDLNPPSLKIAVVSNNATVDRRVFSHHLRPRLDLLFAGDEVNGGQNRGDHLPRQWLTRLLFLAHSPFEITWALDSNVETCTRDAAHAFLSGALASRLWGFDIAHASQRISCSIMYPHNFNIVYRWSPLTASLLRDWLLFQVRRGVATDDQKTLHLAELRHIAAGTGLRVGRIAPPFAAAFYPAPPPNGGGRTGEPGESVPAKRSSFRRVTPMLRGRVHVIHVVQHGLTNLSQCEIFNLGAGVEGRGGLGARQVVQWKEGRTVLTDAKRGSVRNVSRFGFAAPASLEECAGMLGQKALHLCLLAPSSAAGARAARRADKGCGRPDLADGWPYVVPATMETLQEYLRSPRCGELCAENRRAQPAPEAPTRRATACARADGVALAAGLAQHVIACPAGHALGAFGLVGGEEACPGEGGAAAGRRARIEYSCVRLGAASAFPTTRHASRCSEARAGTGLALIAPRAGALDPGPAAHCPSGSALQSLALSPAGCAAAAAAAAAATHGAPVGRAGATASTKTAQVLAAQALAAQTWTAQAFRFNFSCVRLGGEAAVDRLAVGRLAAWALEGTRAAAGGASNGATPAAPLEPSRAEYSARSLCASGDGALESLESHPVACGGASHLLAGVAASTDGCDDAQGGAAATLPRARLAYRCTPNPHAAAPPTNVGPLEMLEVLEDG